ncbi:MAG: porin [Pseudomonadota bacterium]|nr:porin [Pseudomonadota bacterium]
MAKLHHPGCTIQSIGSGGLQTDPEKSETDAIPKRITRFGALDWKFEGKTMKKILFASTALVATAGVAAAEISFGGSANFGIMYKGSETIVKNEIDFDIKGSGETDSGLKFGASLDIDGAHVDSTDAGFMIEDPEVYIEMGGLKLTVGDIGEANDVGGISDIGFDGLGVDDVVDALRENGNDDVRVDYSFGDIAVAASVDSATNGWAISAAGSFGDISASAGYRDNDGASDWNVTLGYSAGAFGVTATYADSELTGRDGFGLDASYSQGDLTVTAAYAESDGVDAYGIGASYSLGGGAAVAGGVAEVGGETVADLGMTFSF